MNIKFSIVMPAYNAAKYIASSIESVINQSYLNWELIIVNDASTDGTEDIIRRYMDSDSRIHLYTNTVSRKAGGSRNIGISQADGDYLMFLDSDDTYTPDILSHLVKVIHEKQYDILIFPFDYIKGEERGCYLPQMETGPLNLADYDMTTSCVIWDKVWRREFVETHQLCCGETTLGEDIIFVLPALFLAKSLFYLNKTGVLYRIHDASVSHKKRSIKEGIRQDDLVIHACEERFKHFNIYNQRRFNWLISLVPLSWSISFYPLMNKAVYQRTKSFFLKSGLKREDYEAFGHLDIFEKYQKLVKYPYWVLYIKYIIKRIRKLF